MGGMIDQFVGAGDFRQRDSFADFESCPTGFERGVDIARRLHFRLGREIVAAEKVDADILEDHLPERNLGRRVVGSIAGDGAIIFQQLDVGIDIGAEGDFDDMIDAIGRGRPLLGGRKVVSRYKSSPELAGASRISARTPEVLKKTQPLARLCKFGLTLAESLILRAVRLRSSA